ncbi:hypothetical protein ABW21_db0203225 [Orbilia brochopaga]|nr:hypothetical protein ABW21_db0203225 [Drechslerella brochopaga]
MLKVKRSPCNKAHKDPNLKCEICGVIPEGVVIKPSDWPPEAREHLRAANVKEHERLEKPLPITPKPSVSVLKPIEESESSESIYKKYENQENIDPQIVTHVHTRDARCNDPGPSSVKVPRTPEIPSVSPTPSLTTLPSPSSTTISTAMAMTIKKIQSDNIEVLHFIPIKLDKAAEQKEAMPTKDKGKGRADLGYPKKADHQKEKYECSQSHDQKENTYKGQLRVEPTRKSPSWAVLGREQIFQHGGRSPVRKGSRGTFAAYTSYNYNRSVSMPQTHRNPTSESLLQVPPTDMMTGKALPHSNFPAPGPKHSPPAYRPSHLATNMANIYNRASKPSSTTSLATTRQEHATHRLAKASENSTAHRQASYGNYLTVPNRPQHDLRRASYGPRARSPLSGSSRPRTSHSPRQNYNSLAASASRAATSVGQSSGMPLGSRPETSMASISTQTPEGRTSDQNSEKKIGKLKKFFKRF